MRIPLYTTSITSLSTRGEGRRVKGRDGPIGMRRKRDTERKERREGGTWGTGS